MRIEMKLIIHVYSSAHSNWNLTLGSERRLSNSLITERNLTANLTSKIIGLEQSLSSKLFYYYFKTLLTIIYLYFNLNLIYLLTRHFSEK